MLFWTGVHFSTSTANTRFNRHSNLPSDNSFNLSSAIGGPAMYRHIHSRCIRSCAGIAVFA